MVSITALLRQCSDVYHPRCSSNHLSSYGELKHKLPSYWCVTVWHSFRFFSFKKTKPNSPIAPVLITHISQDWAYPSCWKCCFLQSSDEGAVIPEIWWSSAAQRQLLRGTWHFPLQAVETILKIDPDSTGWIFPYGQQRIPREKEGSSAGGPTLGTSAVPRLPQSYLEVPRQLPQRQHGAAAPLAHLHVSWKGKQHTEAISISGETAT